MSSAAASSPRVAISLLPRIQHCLGQRIRGSSTRFSKMNTSRRSSARAGAQIAPAAIICTCVLLDISACCDSTAGCLEPAWSPGMAGHRPRVLRLRGAASTCAIVPEEDAARRECGDPSRNDGRVQGSGQAVDTGRGDVEASLGVERTSDWSSESARLSTFSAFTSSSIFPLTAERLAAAGFVHMPAKADGKWDRCVCASCGLVLQHWKKMDDPFLEHVRHFNILQAAAGRAAGGSGKSLNGSSVSHEGREWAWWACSSERSGGWAAVPPALRECSHISRFSQAVENYMQEATRGFGSAILSPQPCFRWQARHTVQIYSQTPNCERLQPGRQTLVKAVKSTPFRAQLRAMLEPGRHDLEIELRAHSFHEIHIRPKVEEEKESADPGTAQEAPGAVEGDRAEVGTCFGGGRGTRVGGERGGEAGNMREAGSGEGVKKGVEVWGLWWLQPDSCGSLANVSCFYDPENRAQGAGVGWGGWGRRREDVGEKRASAPSGPVSKDVLRACVTVWGGPWLFEFASVGAAGGGSTSWLL